MLISVGAGWVERRRGSAGAKPIGGACRNDGLMGFATLYPSYDPRT